MVPLPGLIGLVCGKFGLGFIDLIQQTIEGDSAIGKG